MKALRWAKRALAIVGVSLGSMVAVPQLLAFPYRADVGTTRVYAESPLDVVALRKVLHRVDARLATSRLYNAPVGTRVFLTNGGWRWRLLALTNAGSLGFTRPVSDLTSDAVFIHRGDVARDQVPTAYGTRRLSGIIAHERTHIMVRRHLGLTAGVLLPTWISEGYADHVAGESTLTATQVAALKARGERSPAVFYFFARQRVEAALKANGGDVDALLKGR